jgi:hypothetical protein
MAPQEEVVVIEFSKNGRGGVPVPAGAAQIELGELRRQVAQGLPGIARFARLLEVLGGAVTEGIASERRRLSRPVFRFALGNAAQRVVAVDLVQIVPASLAADELHVDEPPQHWSAVDADPVRLQ